jgi:hypothetical protein
MTQDLDLIEDDFTLNVRSRQYKGKPPYVELTVDDGDNVAVVNLSVEQAGRLVEALEEG